MPILRLYTSVDSKDFPADLVQDMLQIFSRVLKFPTSMCNVHIIDKQDMSYGRSGKPTATVEIKCIGATRETTEQLTNEVQPLLRDKLGIALSDQALIIDNYPGCMIGWDGKVLG